MYPASNSIRRFCHSVSRSGSPPNPKLFLPKPIILPLLPPPEDNLNITIKETEWELKASSEELSYSPTLCRAKALKNVGAKLET